MKKEEKLFSLFFIFIKYIINIIISKFSSLLLLLFFFYIFKEFSINWFEKIISFFKFHFSLKKKQNLSPRFFYCLKSFKPCLILFKKEFVLKWDLQKLGNWNIWPFAVMKLIGCWLLFCVSKLTGIFMIWDAPAFFKFCFKNFTLKVFTLFIIIKKFKLLDDGNRNCCILLFLLSIISWMMMMTMIFCLFDKCMSGFLWSFNCWMNGIKRERDGEFTRSHTKKTLCLNFRFRFKLNI